MIGELSNHIWQSSLFACAAAILAFALRGNRAHVRYWVWLTASLKFLIPFSLLIGLGSHLAWAPTAKTVPSESVPLMIAQFTEPFPNIATALAPRPEHFVWLPLALLGAWACGFAVVIILRIQEWLQIRAILRASVPLEMPFPIAARTSADQFEPGVVGLDLFGVSLPVLLLPAGLSENLIPAELEAVLSHELCHVRRRDNLTAATHMVVEALFWFHPFVWWIGARLLEERERACDEAVLNAGSEPRIYAQGILNVCKLYAKSPSACVSGVTGSNLKKRIEHIMRNRIGANLNRPRKILLAAVTLVALVIPLVAGALTSAQQQFLTSSTFLVGDETNEKQQTPQPSDSGFSGRPKPMAADVEPAFEVAAIKPGNPDSRNKGVHVTGRQLSTVNTTFDDLITIAYSVHVRQVIGGPAWLGSRKYDVIAKANGEGQPNIKQWQIMIQKLLTDRFKLSFHHEKRELPVYAIIVGKTGPKLTRNTNDPSGLPDCSFNDRGVSRVLNCKNTSMADLAMTMQGTAMDYPVVDHTGLEGKYDLTLTWTAEELQLGSTSIRPSPPQASDSTSGPDLFAAIQQQLGLKLESSKSPVDVLVIDHIEEPSPN